MYSPPSPQPKPKEKKTRHHTVKNNWLCKHNLGSSRFAEKYLGVMMNHIHESTMASFSGKKNQLPHQDYEQQCPLQDMWITFPTIIYPRKASFGGLLSIWGNLSNMQIYSGLWVLRTGEQIIRHLWRWDGRPKELELFSWKKKKDWGETWQQFTNRWKREEINFFPCYWQIQKEVMGLNCNKKRFTLDIGKNVRGVSTAIDLPGERRMTSLEISKDRLDKHLSELLR